MTRSRKQLLGLVASLLSMGKENIQSDDLHQSATQILDLLSADSVDFNNITKITVQNFLSEVLRSGLECTRAFFIPSGQGVVERHAQRQHAAQPTTNNQGAPNSARINYRELGRQLGITRY